MDGKRTIAEQILDNIAKIAADEPVERGYHLTAGFEQVLLALFRDSGISQKELQADLEERVRRHRLERLSPALTGKGSILEETAHGN